MTVSDWPLSPLNRLAFIARVSAPPVAMSTRSAVASNLPPDRALTTNGPVRGKEREEKLIFILKLRWVVNAPGRRLCHSRQNVTSIASNLKT